MKKMWALLISACILAWGRWVWESGRAAGNGDAEGC